MSGWPWPGDSPLDIARRVAQMYRRGWERIDPGGVALLDAQMAAAAQRWILPAVHTYEPTDLLTAELAADAMNVSRRTIYSWRERGLKPVETPDGPRYRYQDLQRWVAEARRRRRGG